MKFTFLIAALCLFALPAQAAEAKKIGTYGAWTAYAYTENGAKVCYIAASPTNSVGEYTKRGDVFAMVTHRPADKATYVFSFLAGYDYAANASVSVAVDGDPVTLVGAGDVAWTANDSADRALSDSLRKGKKMTVSGVSARGTKTKDSFSLSGSGSALDAIGKACEIN